MKTQLRLFSLIAVMVLPLAIWANVIVKGHVYYQNGQPASNYAVVIENGDSSSCPSVHVKYTNTTGIYQDTLVCNKPILKVRVWIRDCNNVIISHDLLVPNGAVIIETNFTTCNRGVCKADFLATPVVNATNSIQFDSKNSTVTAGDSIIARIWIFGDGDSTYGNAVSPDHHYRQPGIYTVCLYIKTKNGCESNVCKQVNLTRHDGTCHTTFSFYHNLPNTLTSTDTVHFNSAASTIASGDSIISRKWRFDDGYTLGGNVISPVHVYTNMGTYTACLTTISTSGCTDSFCQTIVVPRMHCTASFNYTNGTDSSFFFDAQPSVAILGDTISQYNWTFGDGATASTKDPHHKYLKPGIYQVCLTIISKKGCTDHVCYTVTVHPPKNCHAKFTFLPITGATNIAGTIHFDGQPSIGDSIIRYHWNFGDGATATTKDPYHTYIKAGNYLACLIIVAKDGCTDTTCTTIVITSPPPTTCAAYFNFTDTELNGHFNSSQINVSQGDSIISRNWTFGDGQSLSGNTISPVHHYKYGGNYQVCLKITTHLGCANEVCKTVHILGDSIPSHTELLKIISVYPNPATTQFNAVIASRYNNVEATLEIYDVYGTLKWSSKKVLSQGNNTLSIPISQLLSGPYIFKVTTIYGVDSKRFFKL